jgi:hypothetical protein
MFFSVGAGAAVVLGGGVVGVVVVVEVDGEGFSLVAHPATTDPIATRAAQPARAILTRLTQFELMIHTCLSCRACDDQIPWLRALFDS